MRFRSGHDDDNGAHDDNHDRPGGRVDRAAWRCIVDDDADDIAGGVRKEAVLF
jgi:hypothetical protein